MLKLEGPLGDYIHEVQMRFFLDMHPHTKVMARREKGPLYTRHKVYPEISWNRLPHYVQIDHSSGESIDRDRLGISSIDPGDALLFGSIDSVYAGDPDSYTIIANAPHSDLFRVLRSTRQLPAQTMLEIARQGLELATAFNAVFGNAFKNRHEILASGSTTYRDRITGQPDWETGKILLPNGENLLRALRYGTAHIIKS